MKNVFTYFRGKTHKRIFAVLAVWSLLGSTPFSAFALPQGGRVGAGNVSWSSVGDTMTISQLSGRAIINWDSFSIGGLETVHFMQPSSSASILNRVTGPYSSEIFGSLLANGNVYLINPNGILFGAGSRINVGGLVASTFELSDEDFNAGRLNFTGLANSGRVVNRGNITASSFAYLIGAGVENHGTITAPAVTLAAGHDKIVIDRTATGGEIRLSVDTDMAPISFTTFGNPQEMANVINSGVIDASGAKGGEIVMQGVNVVQSGTIRADGLEGDGGRISLLGERLVTLGSDSVTTANGGLYGNGGRINLIAENYLGVYERAYIAARGGSLGGNGGFVETSGHQSFVIESAPDVGAVNGRGGEWLIDPHNITIVSASDYGWMLDGNDMMAIYDSARIKVSDILVGLGNGDVTIRAGSDDPHLVGPGLEDGNIYVNADIIYTVHSGTTLTLDAANDIELNANIVAGADNTFGLTAGGDVTQAAGKVVQLGTVDFDVTGSVTMEAANNRIDSLTGEVGGNLTLVNDRNLDLNGLRVADGATTLTVNGNLTDTRANTLKDLTVTTTGNITLDAANDLGEVTATANGGNGDIVLRDAAGDLNDNGIVLRDIRGGTLRVTADDGSITQTAGTSVNVKDWSNLTAAEQITLFNAANDFGGPVSARAKGIRLRDGTGGITLDAVTAGADGLTVRSDDGAIDQTLVGRLVVAGETRLFAREGGAPADITLDNALNDFTGAVHANGGNVELADINSILLGRITAYGTLGVTAWSGNISQLGGRANRIYAQDETTLYAMDDITLNNRFNDFDNGPVNADAVNITLVDRNSIHLGAVHARGTLDVTARSNGDITQNDNGINAEGVATFTALGDSIILDSANNDFEDTVNAYGDTIRLTDGADGISIGRVTGGGDTAAGLVVIRAIGGDITDAQGETVGHDADTGFATMTGPRTVNIIADNLLLNADGNVGAAGTPLDISAGTLAARAGGSVWLYETDALTIGTVDGVSGIIATQNAKVETIGGTLTVGTAVTAGTDVLLAANGAGADVAVNAAAEAGGNLTVLAANGIYINDTLTAGQSLYAAAGGGIFNAAMGGTPNIIAHTAQLVTGGSIGGAGGTESDVNPQALVTSVDMLAVAAGGSVYLLNVGGDLTIGDVDAIGVNRVALDSTTTLMTGDGVSGATAGTNLKIVNADGDFTVASGVITTTGDILLWAQTGELGIGADVTAGNLLTLMGDGVTLDASLSAGGDIAVDAGSGDIQFVAGASMDAESIRLTGGDIALDRLTARDAVSIVASGNITDVNEDETANIIASRVRLQAGGSIGAGDGAETDTNAKAVDIVADNVEVLAGNNLYLQADGAVTVGGVGDITFEYARFDSGTSTLVDGNLTGVTAGEVAKIKAGTLTVDETILAGTHALLLTTVGDLTLNATLTAGDNATLTAAGALRQNASITAGGDISLSGASILTANGVALHGANVRYAAAGDVALGRIVADGLVNIIVGGNITDANHDQTPNIIAETLRLVADGSIGTLSDALDIEVDTLALRAGGEAHLRSDGDITIGSVDQVETDYARFDSGTSTVVDPPLAGFTTGGDASLTSGNGNIRQTSDGVVDIGGMTQLEALNGNITLENPGNDFHGQVDAIARNVYLRDRNDLFVGRIQATHNGRVRLTAGDSIYAVCGCDAPNVIAGTAEFYAGHNIGAPLYIAVGTILEARAGNDIRLTQVTGNMNILGQVYAGRDVVLDVLHGGIVDADNDGYVRPSRITSANADIFAGGDMMLIADFVGSLYNPVELIAGGSLWLGSHRPPARPNGAFPWVVINGHVGNGIRHINVDPSGVPGLVIYNGQPIWGPWWTARQFQLAQRSLADNYQPNLLETGIVKLPWFLHPDMSLLSPSAVRDDLREAEQKSISGAEEDIPADEPRTKTIGLPVTMLRGQ